ncbi:MAG: NAD(P)-dependent alcohol dehydrogenase [Myxococcales bacterium]|nr:NAD(P)-dependent alcohol dehydrogenase [Myxococcales bacterium]
MKAMGQRTWTKGEPLALIELEDPTPRAGEVRVRVRAIGVNPVDWKMREGGPLRLALRLVGPPLPFIPGVDFAGVVDAIGAQVTEVKVGDRVVGGTNFARGQRGSYADTVVVRPDQICKLPDAVPFDVAGALPVVGVTAWMSLVEIGHLSDGAKEGAAAQALLLLGASGGVGHVAVQIAKLRGARVVGVCSSKNADAVRAFGADVVLDYGAGDPLVAAREHGPFQVVVDCVGGYKGSACRALLGPGGRHVMIAGDKPGAMAQVLIAPIRSKSVLGRATTERLSHLVDAIAQGKLRVQIVERFPLAEVEKAHAQSKTGRMTGKMVLLV